MPSFPDNFGLVRVINLPDRTDRLREMKRQLKVLGTSFKDGQVELYSATRPTETCGFPNIGARGCFLSHLAVLKDARQRRVGSLLVIEDDLEVFPADVPHLNRVLDRLAAELWGILYLGHAIPPDPGAAPGLVPFRGDVQNAHFYAVNAPIFDRLIAYLEACLVRPPGDPIGGPMHYDGALTMFRAANPDVITLISQPSLAAQRSSRSDITFRQFEQYPVLREGMCLARLLKRALRSGRRRTNLATN